MPEKNPVTLVVTPTATLSYPHLDQPQAPQKGQAGKPKYSATLVFAEGTDLTALQAAVMAAGEEKWPGKFTEMLRVGAVRSPFRKDAEAKNYPTGSVFLNVRSEQKPGVVYLHAGADKKPAVVPDEKIKEDLYPGASVRAQLRAFSYDSNGNKGVSFALNNIQKLGDGERLDNRQAATDAFEADLSAAPADISALL
jgi:hypothetical protein